MGYPQSTGAGRDTDPFPFLHTAVVVTGPAKIRGKRFCLLATEKQ